MTRDEAIKTAEEFVRGQYPKVPEVGMVSHGEERGERVFVETWLKRPGSTRWRESSMWMDERIADAEGFGDKWRAAKTANGRRWIGSGWWTVHFFMSWDTDELGMPLTLAIVIDDADGRVIE